MQTNSNRTALNPFYGAHEVIVSIKDRVIDAMNTEQREQRALDAALRDYLNAGMSIDDLSAASGLAPAEIRRRIDGIVVEVC